MAPAESRMEAAKPPIGPPISHRGAERNPSQPAFSASTASIAGPRHPFGVSWRPWSTGSASQASTPWIRT